MRRHPRALVLAGLALAASAALAHVRLKNPSNGNSLFWSGSSVSVVLQADGSDDLPAWEHLPALQGAIAAWNGASGSDVELLENSDPAQRARTDWQSNSIRLVLFDEDNDSGYFPSGSGIVALTPVYFQSNGRITDADILFNGRAYRFTTSGEAGAYDIEDVGAHEFGHLLGLDHSGWAGATMYPYVDTRVVLHRSLSRDEVHGLRSIDADADFARVRGRIVRASDGSAVAGAHVVARGSGGQTITSRLSGSSGDFRLDGLESGTYQLYATPLEGPVRDVNLGEAWTVETDFESTLLGTHEVVFGEDLELGDLAVGADVEVSLGRSSDDFPMRVVQGQTVSHSVRGTALQGGGTLSTPHPGVVVDDVGFFGTLAQFNVTVDPGVAPGHVDLEYVDLLGRRSILTGALEITPADPSVTLVTPASGSDGGGSTLTLVGTGFRPGARVVIGDRLYVDGQEGGCTVVDDSTIELTTARTIGGLHDVVVIDPTGVEGRLVDGFRATAVPVVEALFPTAGSSAGGTQLTISGADFVEGVRVTIDGVEQTQVEHVDEQLLRVTTEPGTPAGPVLVTIENPSGALATAAFTYVDAADPRLVSATPDSGPRGGGTEVTLSGSGFVAGMQVRFGADPLTGQGGVAADVVELLDAGTLRVVTPSTNSGLKSIVVVAPQTSQGDVLEGAFQFEGDGGGGGGGGGCASVRPMGPPTPGRIAAGLSWFLLAWLGSLALGARLRRRVAAA